ncbi:hypothetical protein GOODEAATRI_023101 [Goodea atripinnis]|uniref:30S ribosomal protein S3, chloroplastic n=1 Tax=Goodea atripinnis TaxID=208336 RepID=A0ABV0NYB8_9TELE
MKSSILWRGRGEEQQRWQTTAAWLHRPLTLIAAKIGGDGVAAPPTNEFGYGGQKRPLEDAGGYFPMPNLNIDSGGMPDRAAKRLLSEIVEKGRPAPAFHHNDGPGMTVQEIMVPASKAGLVIGKGGETIKSLQERAGVKMVMIQDGPQNTGADKPLRISGDPFKVQVPVPRFAVGIVIGRNGEMIKKIQNDTGVRIQFKPDPEVKASAFDPDDGTTPDRIAQIMGPPDQAQHAAEIISDLLRSVQTGGPPGHGGGRGRGRGQGNWNMGPPGGLQEFSFTVPTMKTGLIIGKGKHLLSHCLSSLFVTF